MEIQFFHKVPYNYLLFRLQLASSFLLAYLKSLLLCLLLYHLIENFHGYLQNTDSMGRRAKTKTESIEYNSKTTLDKEPINYANEGNFTMPKEIYELFKNNPEVTLEEFISKAIAVEKSESIPFYVILHSPAPINHNFTINSPVYGFDREFEVKLANKTAKASAKK